MARLNPLHTSSAFASASATTALVSAHSHHSSAEDSATQPLTALDCNLVEAVQRRQRLVCASYECALLSAVYVWQWEVACSNRPNSDAQSTQNSSDAGSGSGSSNNAKWGAHLLMDLATFKPLPISPAGA
jgi:hypothetical protein